MSAEHAEARTRREALALGVAAGGAVLAAGGASLLPKATGALAKAEDDSSILEAAIGLEHRAAFAYRAIARRRGVDAESRRSATLFARQEQEHAAVLIAALEDRGGTAPGQPTGARDVPGLAEALQAGAGAISRFAIELETRAVGTYFDAAAKLTDTRLRSISAEIMANEAQHLVVLRLQLGRDPTPAALVTGRE